MHYRRRPNRTYSGILPNQEPITDKIISKTSGHTTGKITSQHGLFYDYLINSQGEDKARQYLQANEQAIQSIANIIKSENIDCDFEYQDNYVYTMQNSEVEKINKEVEALKKLDFPAKYVTETDLPFKILAGIKFPNQAQFHPGKYANGLANCIKDRIQVYENTKVGDLEKDEDNYTITTDEGNTITAKYVVVATNYPIFNVPGYHFIKMYQSLSYLMAYETEQKLFEGMYINSEVPTITFRKLKDKNIFLIGGMDHKTGEKTNTQNEYINIEKIAKQYYPDAKLIAKWATEDTIPLDKIPYIGEYSNFWPNVFVGTGYKKWGMTSSNVAANIIVNNILTNEKIEEENLKNTMISSIENYEEVFKSTRLEPIKNHEEMKNMIKESITSIALKKLVMPKETIENISLGEGGLVEHEGRKVGIYRDNGGKIYGIKPVCTHLGCELSWNNVEKTWDCPCHGSRFDYLGNSIYAPSLKKLETIEINFEE